MPRASSPVAPVIAMAPAALILIANDSPPLDQVVAAMRDILDDYLPPPAASLPAPGVFAVSITERSVGLGNWRGMETRGVFPLIALKGVRLDAVVRFQLWAANPNDAETAMTDLTARLMADRDALFTSGILKLALETSPPADLIDSLGAWRKTGEFRVLYEFHYEDTDGAESLISRIPIAGDLEVMDSPERETTVVTDEMVRWDNEAAPTLAVRGPIRAGGFSALSFVPGPMPSGTITLTRTFDGAAGTPAIHLTLADFLSAVTLPDTPGNHAQFTFASLTDFLAAFGSAGDPVTLGDWDLDGVADSYQAGVLDIVPAIRLPKVTDRLDIAYQNASFDQVAVVYLRLKRI
jgi:hypothetical protein